MKILIQCLVAFFIIISSVVAFSAPKPIINIDVKNMSCSEYTSKIRSFMGTDLKANAPFLMMWMYGYMSAIQDNNFYSIEQYKKVFTELGNVCANHPNKNVMNALRKSW